MNDKNRETIINIIKKEVVPAIGCTEPISVALCTAKATEILGETPEHIQVFLSANVLKNAMGVGIPGTGGMLGLPIAVALGAIIGKSEYQLEVLKDTDKKSVEKGRIFIDENRIDIKVKDTDKKLYIEVVCTTSTQKSVAVIADEHTKFVYLEKNGDILLDKQHKEAESEEKTYELDMAKIYNFSMTTPISDIDFILESSRLNKSAAEESFKKEFGHELGRTLCCASVSKTMGRNVLMDILSYTSAACDARMAGAMIPVMSNSGSGNQGIAATLPVTIYAERNNKSEEDLVRALTLSHLTVIYIKQSLGRLSALCGCVVAATGSSCGIVHLMGGGFLEVSYAVKNMIANLTGMICDGAKPSCSMKLTSGVSTAVLSALLAMNGKSVTSVEGIIDEDVDKCIRNLTLIGTEGMKDTDKLVLDIMTNKNRLSPM